MENWIDTIEVVRKSGRWEVVGHRGDTPATVSFGKYNSQVKAHLVARGAAMGIASVATSFYITHPLEVVVKGMNGRIRFKDSYGYDPRNIKG